MIVPPISGTPGLAQEPSVEKQPSMAVLLPFQAQACVCCEPKIWPNSCATT